MNIKKSLSLIALSIFLTSLFSNFSSALTSQDIKVAMSEGIEVFTSFFSPFFEVIIDSRPDEPYFFSQVLFLILLFITIRSALSRAASGLFRDNKLAAFIIAAIMSIFSVRYIKVNNLTFYLSTQIGVLGVVIISAIIFLVFFYFVHTTNMGGAGRRLSWAAFMTFFILAMLSIQDQFENSILADRIFWATVLLILIAILFDKNLHYYFKTHELSMFYTRANQRTIAGLQAEYLNILNVNSTEARARRRDIETELARLHATVPSATLP